MNPDSERGKGEFDYIGDSVGGLYRRQLPKAIGSLLTSTVASLIDVVILSHDLGPDMLVVVALTPSSTAPRWSSIS